MPSPTLRGFSRSHSWQYHIPRLFRIPCTPPAPFPRCLRSWLFASSSSLPAPHTPRHFRYPSSRHGLARSSFPCCSARLYTSLLRLTPQECRQALDLPHTLAYRPAIGQALSATCGFKAMASTILSSKGSFSMHSTMSNIWHFCHRLSTQSPRLFKGITSIIETASREVKHPLQPHSANCALSRSSQIHSVTTGISF